MPKFDGIPTGLNDLIVFSVNAGGWASKVLCRAERADVVCAINGSTNGVANPCQAPVTTMWARSARESHSGVCAATIPSAVSSNACLELGAPWSNLRSHGYPRQSAKAIAATPRSASKNPACDARIASNCFPVDACPKDRNALAMDGNGVSRS